MATDIAGSVTPEYTAAIPVSDDGEALTHAGLVQLALPLANRIEYVRQLSGAVSTPDSLVMNFDSADSVLDLYEATSTELTMRSGFSFTKADTGANTYQALAPNLTFATIASGSSNNRGTLEEATYNVRPTDVEYMYFSFSCTNWANAKFNFGIADDTTDLLFGVAGVYWRWTGSGNFEVHNRASSSTTVEGSIAAPANNDAVLLGFRRSGSSIVASFNLTDVATFTPLSSGPGQPCAMFGCSSTSSAIYRLRRYRRSFDYTPFD